nr:reverse transcriptase domain-containing protein [Tanacetum cinerariifolium]
MRTHSSSNLPVESPPNPSASNPKRRNHRRSKQPFILKESPVDTMADQRTMAELLRVPTEGYAGAILVPPILAEQFELKHSLINMMTSDQFFGLEKENPNDHICWFNKITSTIKYKDVPNSAIKLMLFPFSLAEAARRWLEKEPPRSIITWEDLVSKFINELFPPSRTTNLHNEISNFQQRFDESFHEAWDGFKNLLRACPHHGFTELHQLDTFYNALNSTDQDSLNSVAGGNLLERRTQDVLTIIKNKSKVHNLQNKLVVSQVKSSDANSNSSSEIAKLTHAVNQQIRVVTTAMTAIFKQFQATPPPASVKAVEKIYVTCGGAYPYYQCLAADGNTFTKHRDNIQGYVAAAAVNYNQEEDERVEETLTDQDLAEYTIKVRPPFVQKSKPPSQRNFVVHQRDPLYPNIPYPSRMYKQKQQEKNEEKLQELANTPLNENCSAVILKKLPEKLGDPGKFLIPCGFSELKCKALADLGASINLMPLSISKKLGLPELISTRMTLDLSNQAICTPNGIARDVFVLIGKFTFPTDFVIVDYESDLRVPLILGRPFLRTAPALIDVHGEVMILSDGDERLTLNMRHDTSSYSNQSKKESINMIYNYDDSSEDFLENLFSTNHQSGNPTFSSHPELTSPEVKDDVFDPGGGNVLIAKLLDLDSTKDLHPHHNINPLSGSTTSYSPNHLLEEFTDELTLIIFPPGNDDLSFDIDNLADLNDNLVDTMPEMFTDEHALDYSSPSLCDEYHDDLFEVDDFLPSSEYDSFLSEDFSKVDALPSTNNEDKVFNPSFLIQEILFEVITRVAPENISKKLAISHASLILEDFIPPLYEVLCFKEVPRSKILLSFSSENEKKVFKPMIHTSKQVHSSLIPELSHQGYKVFKINQVLKILMKIYLFSHGENIHILDVPCLHFYPL